MLCVKKFTKWRKQMKSLNWKTRYGQMRYKVIVLALLFFFGTFLVGTFVINSTSVAEGNISNSNNGFTYDDIVGKKFYIIVSEYSCRQTMEFINHDQVQIIFGDGGEDDGLYSYYISTDGIMHIPRDLIELTLQSKHNDHYFVIMARKPGEPFLEKTSVSGISSRISDFSTFNNSATLLKDWFLENGLWESTITEDGQIFHPTLSTVGGWWVEDNIFYFDYPDEENGCIDHKAYKIENNKLYKQTDAPYADESIWYMEWPAEPGVDLYVNELSASDSMGCPGDSIDVTWQITRSGTDDANNVWHGIYWSEDTIIDASDIKLKENGPTSLRNTATAVGATTSVTIPTDANYGSTYYIGYLVDSFDGVGETNENNNTRYLSITINSQVACGIVEEPVAPTLTMTTTGTTCTLSWDGIANADGYILYADPSQPSVDFDGAYEYEFDLGNLTSVFFDLWEGACFYVALKAYNSAGSSEFSDREYTYIELIEVPPAPGLTVTTSGNTVTLSWDAVPNADGYTLFYAPYPEASYVGDIDIGNQTSVSFDFWDGAAFYVGITAYNSVGCSDLSNIEKFEIGKSANDDLSIFTGSNSVIVSGPCEVEGAWSQVSSFIIENATGVAIDAVLHFGLHAAPVFGWMYTLYDMVPTVGNVTRSSVRVKALNGDRIEKEIDIAPNEEFMVIATVMTGDSMSEWYDGFGVNVEKKTGWVSWEIYHDYPWIELADSVEAPHLGDDCMSLIYYLTPISFSEPGKYRIGGEAVINVIENESTSPGGSIVGSWGKGHYTDSNGAEYLSLTFYPNGYYIHYESDDPFSEDDNGGGVEYGKYDYNSQTGKLVVTSLIVNENGDHGLSDFVPGGDCEATVTINGNTITFLETCEDGWTETDTFERVKSDSSPIVGSWGKGHYTDSNGAEYLSLTFYPNGYYIHYESDDPFSEDDNGGGVEYGKYDYNSQTGKLVVTSLIVNENGDHGLSDFVLGGECETTATINGDTITFSSICEDGWTETDTFERVK